MNEDQEPVNVRKGYDLAGGADSMAPASRGDDDDSDGGESRPLLSRLLASPVLTGAVFGVIGFFILLSALPTPHLAGDNSVTTGVAAVMAEPPAQETGTTDTAQSNAVTEKPHVLAPHETPPSPEVTPVADVALVIADVGINRRVSDAITAKLPKTTTIAVSPYATDAAAAATLFKSAGHDVWMEIAAQSTKPGIDPGPLAVSGGLSLKENQDLITRQVKMAAGNAVGIYLPDDADITAEGELWKTLALSLIGSNQMILDGTTAKVATELYVQKADAQISAYMKADIIINGAAPPADLQKALSNATPEILRDRQAIVVIAHPTLLSIDAIAAWASGLSLQGVRLVPASSFTGLKP